MAKKPKLYHYCPHCKEEIDNLEQTHYEEVRYGGSVDFEGKPLFDNEWEQIGSNDAADPQEQYFCPECGEEVRDPDKSSSKIPKVIETTIKPENFLRDYDFNKDIFGEVGPEGPCPKRARH